MSHNRLTASAERAFASTVASTLKNLSALDSYEADDLCLRIRALPDTRSEVIACGITALEGYAQAIAAGDPLAQRAHTRRLEAATAVLCGNYGPTLGQPSRHGLDVLFDARKRSGRAWPMAWMLPCAFNADVRGVPCGVACEPYGFGPRPCEFLNVSISDARPGSTFVSTTGFLRIELPVTPGKAFLPAARDFLQHFREAEPLVPVDFAFRRLLRADPESASYVAQPEPEPAPAQIAECVNSGPEPARSVVDEQADLFSAA